MSDLSRSVLSYNKFLRQSAKEGKSLSISTQSGQEQRLALEAIQTFVQHMNSGKVKTRCLMTIRLQFGDSERSLL